MPDQQPPPGGRKPDEQHDPAGPQGETGKTENDQPRESTEPKTNGGQWTRNQDAESSHQAFVDDALKTILDKLLAFDPDKHIEGNHAVVLSRFIMAFHIGTILPKLELLDRRTEEIKTAVHGLNEAIARLEKAAGDSSSFDGKEQSPAQESASTHSVSATPQQGPRVGVRPAPPRETRKELLQKIRPWYQRISPGFRLVLGFVLAMLAVIAGIVLLVKKCPPSADSSHEVRPSRKTRDKKETPHRPTRDRAGPRKTAPGAPSHGLETHTGTPSAKKTSYRYQRPQSGMDSQTLRHGTTSTEPEVRRRGFLLSTSPASIWEWKT